MELVAATQLISWLALARNDFAEACNSCKTALVMTERLLGPNALDTAVAMHNLGTGMPIFLYQFKYYKMPPPYHYTFTAYLNTGNLGQGTEALFKRAIEIYDESRKRTTGNTTESSDDSDSVIQIKDSYSKRSGLVESLENLALLYIRR
jgi:hypothetical protein